jgi:hypothetical protein
MERWTFLILADERGEPAQIRMFLRAGEDPAAWPVLQVRMDGAEVDVDDVAKDYEAPEWKAKQLFVDAGGTEHGWEGLKARLRQEAGAPAT